MRPAVVRRVARSPENPRKRHTGDASRLLWAGRATREMVISFRAQMDTAQLRERARYFRSLAERADEQISGELLYLAEQYERWARDLEQGGANNDSSQ
jgi:hypothetical protein